MKTYRIPVLSDNYVFLLHDRDRHRAAVVDPAIARPVIEQLEVLSAELEAIFITHHCGDHVGGITELLERFPKAIVYGGAHDRGQIPSQQVFLEGGEKVTFGIHQAEVLFVPGHTRAHIAYYFPPNDPDQDGDLFCGDVLFSGGCGRIKKGGTAEQMWRSLALIRSLPDHTRVWCAHEYTQNNLKFAITVDPTNTDLQQRIEAVRSLRSQGIATIPANLGVEKRTNPFLRWDTPAIQQATHQHDPIATFAALRKQKDVF